MKPQNEKAYDITVFGATTFTDNSIGDVTKSGLPEMVANSKVILNLVGPYRQNGSFRLAELCSQQGTHYADLSGESDFNAHLQRSLDAPAKASGAILIPSSGYDSILSDLATYLGVRRVRQLAAAKGIEVDAVEARCGNAMAGSFSGGTMASLISIAETPETRWIFSPERPFEIAGPNTPGATSQMRTPLVVNLPHFNAYGSFFPLGVHNARVAYQSATLVDSEARRGAFYGPKFQFVDAAVLTKGLPASVSLPLSLIAAFIFKLFVTLVIKSRWMRALIVRVVPAGTGPLSKRLHGGYLDLRSLVTAYPKKENKSSGSSAPVSSIGYWMSRKADSGYRMTSLLLCDVGIFLALDASRTTVTPGVRMAASLGDAGVDALVYRLNEHHIFSIGVKDTNPDQFFAKRLVED